MKIRLYIYNQGVSWAQLEVLGRKHLTADCRTFGYYKDQQTIELCTSSTTNKDCERYIAMCERDVNSGYAKAIDLDVEPIEKDWPNAGGYCSTIIKFDYNLLLDMEPKE